MITQLSIVDSRRRSLREIFAWLIALMAAMSVGFGFFGYWRPVLRLNENQILYLFSTSNQVIAAIYGLTLTGLIFFVNELNREELEDETKDASVLELKQRYYSFLIVVTSLVGVTIFVGNGAIAIESVGPGLLSAVFINVGQSAFVVALLAIAIFVFEVVDPKALERASDRVKERIDPTRDANMTGSLEEFMRNFNAIEAILMKYGEQYQYQTSPSPSLRPRKRISNLRLAEFLLRGERIHRSLFEKLRELIALRNSIVHGADPTVSRQLVAESAETLKLLDEALELS